MNVIIVYKCKVFGWNLGNSEQLQLLLWMISDFYPPH